MYIYTYNPSQFSMVIVTIPLSRFISSVKKWLTKIPNDINGVVMLDLIQLHSYFEKSSHHFDKSRADMLSDTNTWKKLFLREHWIGFYGVHKPEIPLRSIVNCQIYLAFFVYLLEIRTLTLKTLKFSDGIIVSSEVVSL